MPWIQSKQNVVLILILLSFTGAACKGAVQPPASTSTAPAANPIQTLSALVPAPLSSNDKQYLQSVYEDTWNYLSAFVEPMSGLPYDSNKKQPATSASNIGLYLASTAIAYRTNLISKQEAITRISEALTSLEKIERWEGFPRVWVTVRGLKPISGISEFSYSKHVSNIIAGLVIAQTTFPDEFSRQIGTYMRGMKFKNMYEKRNGWIKGGYDVSIKNYAIGQPWGNWYYKFLASEARLISFYLIARGFAPESHWKALTRPVQKKEGEWFFVSGYEDGGAYMPYMASLYIDERNTLMGASQRNYSTSQMKLADKIEAPVWGWSASLDTQGEYIPYGELKDEVVSPYASMLAMIHFPHEAIKNLKKLEELGGRPTTAPQTPVAVVASSEKNRGMIPWALSKPNDVFFINKNGSIEKLSDHIDTNTSVNTTLNKQNRDAFTRLAEALGYDTENGLFTDTRVVQIIPGTLLKKSILDQVAYPQQLEELIAIATKTGLYTPGQIEFHDGFKPLVAFNVISNTLVPWAASSPNDVLFVNSNGSFEKLSSYLDLTSSKSPINHYNRHKLTPLVQAINYPLADGQKVDSIVNNVQLPTQRLPSFARTVSNPIKRGDLLSLATDVDLYTPGNVTFHDGTVALSAFVEGEDKGITWLAAAPQGIFFLDNQNNAQNFNDFVDISQIGQKLPNLDPTALATLITAMGKKPEPGESVNSMIKEITAGTFLKEGLANQLMEPSMMGDLLSVASLKYFYTLSQVKFKDGTTAPIAFIREGDNLKPWAIAGRKDIFFINKSGNIEKLRDYLNRKNTAKKDTETSQAPVAKLIRKAGYQPTSEEPLSRFVENVFQSSTLKKDITKTLADPSRLGDLLVMASKMNLYSPGYVQLKASEPTSFGFRDAVDWKKGVVGNEYLTPSQAMGFLSIANVLFDGVVWKSFSEDRKVNQALSVLVDAPEEAAWLNQKANDCFCEIPTNLTT